MATAQEKEYKQAVRDVARSSIVQGAERQAAAIPRASTAFPQRRLRAAGDLSRYAIGGFTGDVTAPLPTPKPTSKPPAKVQRGGKTKPTTRVLAKPKAPLPSFVGVYGAPGYTPAGFRKTGTHAKGKGATISE